MHQEEKAGGTVLYTLFQGISHKNEILLIGERVKNKQKERERKRERLCITLACACADLCSAGRVWEHETSFFLVVHSVDVSSTVCT